MKHHATKNKPLTSFSAYPYRQVPLENLCFPSVCDLYTNSANPK